MNGWKALAAICVILAWRRADRRTARAARRQSGSGWCRKDRRTSTGSACTRAPRRPRASSPPPGTPVEVLWKAPIREDDREQQVEVVEGFISQGVSGLVLAPLDSSALLRPVEEAKSAGIPTVIFDSALADATKQVSYVSHRQRQGRAPGRPAHGRAAEGHGHRADAALPGRIGGHRGARAGLPRRAEGAASPASPSSRPTSTPARRATPRSARRRTCSTASPTR